MSPVPSFRSGIKKPKPFRRPSAEITPVVREWRTVEAHTLKMGDTVPDVGVLLYARSISDSQFVAGGEHNEKVFGFTDQVLAFVRKSDG